MILNVGHRKLLERDSNSDELDDVINTTSLTGICDAQTNIVSHQLSVKRAGREREPILSWYLQ